MPYNCIINGCTRKAGEFGVRMFRVPSKKKTFKDDLIKRRRRLWLAAIRRKDLDLDRTVKGSHRVCNNHFIKGKPALLMDYNDPDWVPTLKLGHGREKKTEHYCNAKNQHKELLQFAKGGSDDHSYCDVKEDDDENKKVARQDLFLKLPGGEGEEMPALIPKDFAYINEDSLICPNPDCVEVKHKLLKDLHGALCEERRLMAKIKHLEKISNINLDLLQLCLDMGQSPEVEVEFQKVIDLVQTIMNPQKWELRAAKECKQTTCDAQTMTVSRSEQGSATYTSTNSHDFSNTRNVDKNINLKNNRNLISLIHDNVVANSTITKYPTLISKTTKSSNANTESWIQGNILPASTAKSSTMTTDYIDILTNCNMAQQQISNLLPSFKNNRIPAPLFSQQQGSGHLNDTPRTDSLQMSLPMMTTNLTTLSSTATDIKSLLNTEHDKFLSVCKKCVKNDPLPEELRPKTSEMLCELCGKWIRCKDVSTAVYQLHMRRAHTKEKPFECEKCGRKFVSKWDLVKHNHLCQNEERSHQCEECGKLFKLKANLKVHRLVHKTDAKLYECLQCNYKTKWRGNLRLHVKNCHQGPIASDNIPVSEEPYER